MTQTDYGVAIDDYDASVAVSDAAGEADSPRDVADASAATTDASDGGPPLDSGSDAD
jgi:hypothetical protein